MNVNLCFVLTFYTIVLYFLNVYVTFYFYYEYFVNFFELDGDTKYDYIIVGCGTAGSLIAHRLGAHGGRNILVLEAGGGGGPLLNPPALGPLLQRTRHDWNYKTTSQDNACLAMRDKKCIWPMGKILGGSARLNNMVHVRSYLDEMVPWFGNKFTKTQLEQFLLDLEEHDLPYEKLNFKTKLSDAVLNAAGESGFSVNNDSKTGFFDTLVNQKNGARWSTSHTLMNNLNPNIKILTNAFVERVIINPETLIASDVVYERFGKKLKASAKNGIIVTSGAIGTPKLLLLSGVGPREHLEELSIPVVKELPVGENLMDHVTTGLDLVLLNSTIDFGISDLINPLHAWNYFVNGNGVWTSSGCEAVAILKTEQKVLPNLQLMVLPVGVSTDHGIHLGDAIGITPLVWDAYFSKITYNNSVTFLPIVLHPKSKGTVRLSSFDPYDDPLIDPKYFSNEADLEILLKGISLIKRLLRTESLIQLGAYLNPIKFPGCDKIPFDTRKYWICYIRHLTLTTYHPAGTCQIGSPTNNNTVVDYDFQVNGIKNLFVADASIFPTLPSGNINTAVALVAKIFSDTIIKLHDN